MNLEVISHVCATILLLIGIGLIATSQATTSWTEDSLIQYGLYQICSEDSLCLFAGWSFSQFFIDLTVTRIILLAADLFIIAGVLATFLAYCLQGGSKASCLKAAGSFNLIAAFTIWIGGAAFTVLGLVVVGRNPYYNYSYAFCWSSGFLFFVVGLIEIIACAKEAERSSFNQPAMTNFINTTFIEPPPYNPMDYNPTAPPPTAESLPSPTGVSVPKPLY